MLTDTYIYIGQDLVSDHTLIYTPAGQRAQPGIRCLLAENTG